MIPPVRDLDGDLEDYVWVSPDDTLGSEAVVPSETVSALSQRLLDITSVIGRLTKEGQSQAIDVVRGALSREWGELSSLASLAGRLPGQEDLGRVIGIARVMAHKLREILPYSEKEEDLAPEMAQSGGGVQGGLRETIDAAKKMSDQVWEILNLFEKDVLDKEIAAARKIQDRDARVNVLSEIVEKLLKIEDIQRALEITAEIGGERGLQSSYLIIGKLVEIGERAQANSMATKMPNPISRSRAWIVIAEKLAEKKEIINAREAIDNALRATEQISNAWSKYSTLAKIAEELPQIGDTDWALEVAKQIPDPMFRYITFSKIAQKLVTLGDLEMAIDAIKLVPDDQWQKSDALYEIARKLVQREDIEEAIKIANRILNVHKKSEIVYAISEKLLKKRDIDRALVVGQGISYARYKLKFLSQIIKWLVKMKEIPPSKTILEVASQLVKKEKIEWARNIVNMGSDEHEKSEAFCMIALKLIEMKDIQQALIVGQGVAAPEYRSTMLSEIINQLVNMEEISPARTLVEVVRQLVEKQKLDWAQKIANIEPDEQKKSEALSVMALKLIERKDIEQALIVSQGISTSEYKSRVLLSFIDKLMKMKEISKIWPFLAVILELVDRGRIGWAQKMVVLGPDDYEKANALCRIALKLVERGDIQMAINAVREISHPTNRIQAFQNIIEQLVEKRDIDGAIYVIEKMSYPDSRDKSKVLQSIVEKLVELNEIDKATFVVEKIPPQDQSQALLKIVKQLVKLRKIPSAKKIADMISDEFVKTEANQYIFR